jgi:hypothetical protein
VIGFKNLLECDDAGRDEIGIVEDRAERVTQRVPQFAAFVDAAGRLGRNMAGDSAGKGELSKEDRQAGFILGDARIDLGVGALQVSVRDQRRPSVART